MRPQEYDALPKDIQKIIDSFNHDADWYQEMTRIGWKLKAKGYSAIFYLGGGIDVKRTKYTENK